MILASRRIAVTDARLRVTLGSDRDLVVHVTTAGLQPDVDVAAGENLERYETVLRSRALLQIVVSAVAVSPDEQVVACRESYTNP